MVLKANSGRFPAGLFGQTKCHHHHYLKEVKFQNTFYILRDSILLDHNSATDDYDHFIDTIQRLRPP